MKREQRLTRVMQHSLIGSISAAFHLGDSSRPLEIEKLSRESIALASIRSHCAGCNGSIGQSIGLRYPSKDVCALFGSFLPFFWTNVGSRLRLDRRHRIMNTAKLSVCGALAWPQ